MPHTTSSDLFSMGFDSNELNFYKYNFTTKLMQNRDCLESFPVRQSYC